MNSEEYWEYCLANRGVTEETPLGPDTLVFKVGGKIFAMTSISEYEEGFALKFDPEKLLQYREEFEADVRKGAYLNQKHWASVRPHGNLPVMLLKEWIDQSYFLVYSKLSRSLKLVF